MRISIVGITGYSGLELLRILQHHPRAKVVSIHATKEIGRFLSELYPHLKGLCDLKIEVFDSQRIMQQADLVFFATPSGVAKEMVADFIAADFPVIDLSGDHRLPGDIYKKWYKKVPAQASIQKKFIYALSEFVDVSKKHFIANPGCYATATELALVPLLQAQAIELDSIIVDAKSGLTGAGKNPTEASHFVQVHDNYITYKLNQHQHIPEIVQFLQNFDEKLVSIQFSTSLIPVNRGIVATVYVKLKKGLNVADISSMYRRCYQDKPFVRVQAALPTLHQVIGTNYTDIGFDYNPVTNILTVVAVLDNLVKGAAGQAVQNMNLMFAFPETEGLLSPPLFV
ncbi:N-acetyl-gamma-glutamyl-phosphate reductase [Streptococcus sp. Marseille-P7376]|uniref:N-acetyl-gamma-glutamyl-phosphate reductase n=1 Tax=Streptococcus sp. Marseille-P7376 TaxID=2592044 RepID=UPI0011E7A284|nr:N-acetyl-gamma-glutamyl-phosphate reductase [Streptococcus sp. Marseille-P7376]